MAPSISPPKEGVRAAIFAHYTAPQAATAFLQLRLWPRRPGDGGTPLGVDATVGSMYDADRPAVVIAWIECKFCGRIEKAAQDFNLPDDVATDMELWVWFPCERCGRDAKLHFRRELKPAH
jgi:hypothetical protein